MQRSLIPLFLFLLVVFLSACQPQAPRDMLTAKLDSLENRIAANPDSVADVLNAREALFSAADEATRMRFELLRTAALFKAHRTPNDDRPMRAVAAYYERKAPPFNRLGPTTTLVASTPTVAMPRKPSTATTRCLTSKRSSTTKAN